MYAYSIPLGFPAGSVVKNLPANAGDTGLISGSGRFPGEVNGNPHQYSCLENPMDRGAQRRGLGREELSIELGQTLSPDSSRVKLQG